MDSANLADRRYLQHEQYRSGDNLSDRIQLHERFSTNRQGWFRWLFDRLEIAERASILDVGCGTAALWFDRRDQLRPDWAVTLADFSPGMVATARNRLAGSRAGCTFCIADVRCLPFAGDAFDVVIANHMLYHVPDRPGALAEIRRVLRPGGRFFAATNGQDHLREIAALLARETPNEEWDDQSLGFSLENGAAQLAPWFACVTREDYPDGLEITEVEPLVAYLRSTCVGTSLDHVRLDHLRDEIATRIGREGAVHVTKSVGVFSGLKAF